jgi:hypothetical protein
MNPSRLSLCHFFLGVQMNKTRRAALEKLSLSLSDIKNEVETILGEEQEYKDNMPESLQSGEKGDAADSAIQSLEEAVSSLDDAISSLDDASA